MKRLSIVASAALLSIVGLAAQGCSSEAEPGENIPGGNTTAGTTSTPTAGNTSTPTAGNTSTGTAGSTSTTGGTGSGTAGTGSTTAGTTGTGGTGNAGGAGSTGGTATTGGTPGTGGGTGTPGCPEKIDSAVMCTQIVSCPGAYCGVFKLGAKDCSCAAASGAFTCSSCSYAGKTEEIVLPPATVLAPCTGDDMTLEKGPTGCTKGTRCKSLDTTKNRFCACWDDGAGSTKWDCDSQPAAWPM